MGKKISQYSELSKLTGEEFTILAINGTNYRTKISTITALVTGTENSFAQIEAQVNTNKLAIQSINDTISNIAVNLNNTMGSVNIAVNTVNNLSTKVASNETSIAQLTTELAQTNAALSALQAQEAGEMAVSLVFDQADW